MNVDYEKDWLSVRCPSCDRIGVIFVDDSQPSFLAVCQRCNGEATDVWCSECGVTGDFVEGIDRHPSTWACPRCGATNTFLASFYENPFPIHFKEDLPDDVRSRIMPVISQAHIASPDRPIYTLSNQADVEACRRGVWPEAQRKKARSPAVRNTVLSIVIGVLFFILGLSVEQSGYRGSLLVGTVLLALAAYSAGHTMFITSRFLSSPQISHTEDYVTKSSTTRVDREGREHRDEHRLICEEHTYECTPEIWDMVIEGGYYRLWYSAATNEVLAFELAEPGAP